MQDSERARALLESTALLEFYIVKDVTTTNELMIKIDQVLKGDESIADLAKDTEAKTIDETSTTDDGTVSVSELFGESADEVTTDSAVVNEDVFADRPFSAMLRNLGNTIGVPAKNVYAVRKMLATPKVQGKMANIGGIFFFRQLPVKTN